MASPGSTTGTDSLGDSSGNLASTDTSGGSGLTSPTPVTTAGVMGGCYPSPPGLITPSPPGAPSLPTSTITAITSETLIPNSGDSSSERGISSSAPTPRSIIGQELAPKVVLAEQDTTTKNVKCPWCGNCYKDPKVLACFHTFCKPCLESFLETPGKILCPQCSAETQLCVDLGIDSLLSDYGLANLMEKQEEASLGSVENGISGNGGGSQSSSSSPALDRLSGSSPGLGSSPNSCSATCTGCKSKESVAVAHCQDCANFLCANCVMAHQYMHCFEGHRVRDLAEFDRRSLRLLMAAGCDKPVSCLNHRSESVKYFCFTCNIPVCAECTIVDHPRGLHQFEAIQEIAEKQLEVMQALLNDARNKHQNLIQSFGLLETGLQRLNLSYGKAQNDINEAAALLTQLIEDQRIQAIRDLENSVGSKQVALNILEKKVHQTINKLSHTVEFMDRLLKYASPTEALVFKKLLETRLQVILNYQSDMQNLNVNWDLEFVPSNGQTMRSSIASAFGYVRMSIADSSGVPSKMSTNSGPAPIGRPPSRQRQASAGFSGGGMSPGSMGLVPTGGTLLPNGTHPAAHAFSDSNLLQAKQEYGGSSTSLGPYSTMSDPQGPPLGAPYPYKEWSSGSDMGQMPAVGADAFTGFASSPEQVVELSSRIAGLFPPRSQIKRHKMIYHCKFGEFGVMEGQFTEPSGVAVNAQNDIIVADTNNHRIQVFDKEGRFKFQFGECGKRDGQLLYPNRVTVNRLTGDIVVTERSPTHQIQVYNQYGQFLRKFGANILQHPRGVTVDSKGRIVVIECKVMRVLIFDMYGNVLQKFSCSRYLEFPNGVCTNDKQEIFVSDNRAHCVKVFNYDGQFLRQIGGEGVTNYPIGVGINQLGEVVVADNHNNFNLSIFQQEGTLVNALESKVKHAQCFDVTLLDEGTVVLASKDYRLYLYRYIQNPQNPFPHLA